MGEVLTSFVINVGHKDLGQPKLVVPTKANNSNPETA